MKSLNREGWLSKFTEIVRADFAKLGFTLPEKIRSTCGWPSKSATARKNRRIGEAWSSKSSEDATFEVFISPVLKSANDVGATLVHELVHCAVGLEAGHKGPFAKCAKAIGLEGKMTATVAGKELQTRIAEIATRLGDYPHATLRISNAAKKQTTRLIKVACGDCGCVLRMTRKWLEEVGCPTCGCGGEMVADGGEETEDGEE